MPKPHPPTREWTVLAQDPSLLRGGTPLLAKVRTATERLLPGPRGHRVAVIDYDSSTDTLYKPRQTHLDDDPWADSARFSVDDLVEDPHFHAQNAYAIVMATLFQFESALGRNAHWGFTPGAQQIKIAPHGLAEANAFYSRRDEALIFGYFPESAAPPGMRPNIVFSCLSYDVVAHETTHALLDGLRPSYTRPSSPDQAAFHEGFADLVAILSVFRFEEVVRQVLDPSGRTKTLADDQVGMKKLAASPLLTLAEQMGRGAPLRASATTSPSPDLLTQPEFQPAHRRGEVLVAAVLHAFLDVWHRRIKSLDPAPGSGGGRYPVGQVVEQGAKAAGHLLNMTIRALDYCPPTDVTFSDYLSAILTGDFEVCPDDTPYRYRELLLESFARFGIAPATGRRGSAPGVWQPPQRPVSHDLVHFAALRQDPAEAFRFLWENQQALDIDFDAETVIESLRPIVRLGPDGFVLHETVATYGQTLTLRAAELHRYGIEQPDGMPSDHEVRLYGGGTLMFDEYGRLKYHVGTGVRSSKQSDRLRSRWERGDFQRPAIQPRRFALAHRDRSRGNLQSRQEAW